MRGVVIGVAILTGCGSAKQASPPSAGSGSAAHASKPVAASLPPGDMRLVLSDDGEGGVRIHEDGTIETGSRDLQLRLVSHGDRLELFAPPRTDAILTLEPDGSIDPEGLGATIGADGALTIKPGSMFGADEVRLAFGADGRLVFVEEQNGQGFRVDGATTPALRRTAMFVFLGLVLVIVGAAMSRAAGPQMQSGTSMHVPNKQ
jgi:hypothetical protein